MQLDVEAFMEWRWMVGTSELFHRLPGLIGRVLHPGRFGSSPPRDAQPSFSGESTLELHPFEAPKEGLG